MNDPLFGNMVAAAVLTALLLVFGLPQLTAALFGGGHHASGHDGALHLAYCCVDLETPSGGAAQAAAPADLGALLANASAAAGERRAALCKSCHTFEQGGADGAGPNLWDIVERPVAGVDGFNYTNAIKEFGGAWTYERLDAYIRDSQEYIPGTAMIQRFARDNQRADILAYLQTLSPDPVPFPAPAETEAPADAAAEASDEADGESEEDASHSDDSVEIENAEDSLEDADAARASEE